MYLAHGISPIEATPRGPFFHHVAADQFRVRPVTSRKILVNDRWTATELSVPFGLAAYRSLEKQDNICGASCSLFDQVVSWRFRCSSLIQIS
jgi:hypothetical protein